MSLAEEVEAFFAGRPEPRLRALPGRRSYGPSRDDEFDQEEGEERNADLGGLSLHIVYRDASGATSQRTIRCHKLRTTQGVSYIDAYCLWRRAQRTFRLDRIANIFDYSTGEELGDVRGFFAEQIGDDISPPVNPGAKGSERIETRFKPATSNPRIAAAFRDGARVLLFVAMSDGELHPRERELVVSYATDRLSRIPQPPADANGIVTRWINNHVPTRASTLDAWRRLNVNPADGRELAHAMIDLMIADGTASDGEMAIAWNLVKILEEQERMRPSARP